MGDGPFIRPAANKVGNVKYPIVNLGDGSLVNVTGDPANYQPGYHPASEGGGNVVTDPSRNLAVRAQILTDEGSFRANFSGASLAVSIGTCTFTNGSATVTGTALDTYDLHLGDYVKLDADAETDWAQVDSVDSPTQLTLTAAYTGTGGTSAAGCSIVKPVTGAGGSITVGSGQATIACGTTATAVHEIERDVDYGPLLFQAGISVSQRIANQDIYIGVYDEEHSATPYYYAWFRLNGTTNTTVICESGGKRDGVPSGGEIETTTATLPNGQTTATSRRYRIEVMLAKLRFYIDGILVAEHYKSMPRPMDKLTATVRVVNGTTPASGTNVLLDYLTTKNFNAVDVTIPGEQEGVIANQAAMESMTYSVAGIIALNTVLLVRDCSQCRGLVVQCTSMGTTGVVTPEWSNDGTTWITATGFSESGASSTTFNAAVLRRYNVIARYFRLRMSTATTAGTTTIITQCLQSEMQQWLATQPVSGTVTNIPATGQGSSTALRRLLTADTNAANVKNGAGVIGHLSVYNDSATKFYLKMYNKASAPTLASDVPDMTIPVNANSNVQIDCGPWGLRYATGISIAVVRGIGDTDTTAVAANDGIVCIRYT